MNEAYLRRMREQLDDFEAYAACLDRPPERAVRINAIRARAEEAAARLPFALGARVPWEQNGYYIDEEKPGRSIWHDAGLFYVQEPSAMCAAPLLQVRPGDRVLDLCAAPGGKSGQLAAAMQGQGILVLNEKMPDRARVLLQNVERLGITNAIVTCASPEVLAERFEGYFDKVLVDAPCSGEGMLRKEPEASVQWSEEVVRMCAQRQSKILDSAARMVAGGGSLVYSTCTFSREEDEENADGFVRRHPEFCEAERTKLYPHRVRGEGHFAALFHRADGDRRELREAPPADRRAVALWKNFAGEFVRDLPNGTLCSFGDSLSLAPEGMFRTDGLRVLRAGLLLGEQKNGRFEPAHALAMGLSQERFCNVAQCDAAEIERYLRGEELPARGARGWCVVACDGFVFGLGKIADALKNKLPKGLRRTL